MADQLWLMTRIREEEEATSIDGCDVILGNINRRLSINGCDVILGNINQSLMVLRNCIEILRENQKQAANKVCFLLVSIVLDQLQR